MSNIVERLRSPANVFYEYAADNGAFLREAADAIEALLAERDALKAELAAVTKERDRMREALKPFAAQLDHPGNTYEHNGVRMALVNQDILDRLCRRARAALEGVTEPTTGDSNA